MQTYIHHATIFDGLGGEGYQGHVLIENGKIKSISRHELTVGPDCRRVDASGKWLMPGFIDIHTHYDGEIEINPSLDESLRHGVTTTLMGSCGISMVMGNPEELSDMFTRVEGIPSAYIKDLLVAKKDWDSPSSYFKHLEQLNLGPNIALFLGHSTIRAYVMGLGRSLSHDNKPSIEELKKMDGILNEALDQGYLGLSVNMLEFDKMDGSEFRSRPTPSVFADWKEYRYLFKTLRERERILQTVPNTANPLTFFSFILESRRRQGKGLKTSMLAMIDGKAARGIHRVFGNSARLANRYLGAEVKFQGLPEPFDVVTHGFDSPFFEEFESGTSYLHLQEVVERRELLANRRYRNKFRSQWQAKFMPRVFHRKLRDTSIVKCPDPSLEGRSFRDLAKEKGRDEIDYFLDLISQYGDDLHWYTVVGNDRVVELNWIVQHPDCHIGFSDAGAHLKNMAHYNFGLRLLKFVEERRKEGQNTLSIGQAVKKVSKDLADWFLLPNLGSIEVGKRADLVLVDPAFLNDDLDEMSEAPMPGLPSFKRLVRRNDAAVPMVMVNGRVAWEAGKFDEDLGKSQVFGQLIRATERV
jgi:N-acyl-D-aspartate/D-glutamate deacylase